MQDQFAPVGEIIREGLTTAQAEGVSQVRAAHLSDDKLDRLAGLTLAHLRAQPGRASRQEGWSAVSPRSAGVMTWWAVAANLTETERPRLRALRREVYDLLERRQLIEKGPGQGAFVHVSPPGHDPAIDEAPAKEDDVADEGAFGAWVLKLSPYVYDANRVFAAPDRLVHRWSVDDNDRSADMRHGQLAYLWVGDGDPVRMAGIWGVGWVIGPCESGTPDDGWFDREAADRAKLFAVVAITLVDIPISRSVFLNDERLAGTEVILDPISGNPGRLTAEEAAALAEYLPWTPDLPAPIEA